MAVGLLALSVPAAAEWGELGPQFQVNTYTTSNQYRAAVSGAPDGGFAVVWDSNGDPSGQSGRSIVLRRFDSAGSAIGDQVQVSTGTTSARGEVSIAHAPDRSFLVAWRDSAPGEPEIYPSQGIRARRFSSEGLPAASEIQVNVYTTENQKRPAVAALEDGTFVVTWQSRGSGGTDQSSYSVQARRFSSGGVPLGGEIQVNSYTLGDQRRPSVEPLSDGSFVVAFENVIYTTAEVDSQNVRIGASGDLETVGGPREIVGGSGTSAVTAFDAAVATGNGLVVAWRHNSIAALQLTRIEGVSVGSAGAAVASFPISATQRDQGVPDLAAGPDGTLVATWRVGSPDPPAGDGSSWGIRARAFDSLGIARAEEVTVNAYTAGQQESPDVAALQDGRFVIVWDSVGSVGNDSSGYSIQARILAMEPPVFTDDFEAGNLDKWSESVGAPGRALDVGVDDRVTMKVDQRRVG